MIFLRKEANLSEKELTPRQQARREAILESARRLFLDKGFAGTSTDAIADEAGVSKQTLYVYYPNKEELFAAVLHRQVEKLLIAVQPEPAAPVALDAEWLYARFRGIAQVFLNIAMQPDYLALIRVIVAEAPRFPQLTGLFRAAVVEQGLAAIAGVLKQAAQAGLVEINDYEIAARLFIGPLLTFAILDGLFVVDRPVTPPDPARIDDLVAMYLRSLTPPAH